MSSFLKYISGIYTALKSLVIGLTVTWKELWTKKVTMQYPENRETLVISDRWRAELIMPHDDNNEHACTACGICMMNCPNGTINVISKMVETEEGKQKKVLDKHIWDYGMCTYCNLCVITCPSNAIVFSNDFEGAVYNREKLVHQLNKEGSKLREKKKEPVAAAPKPQPAAPKEAVAPKAEPIKVEVSAPKETAPTSAVADKPTVEKANPAPKKEAPKASIDATEKAENKTDL